MPIPIDDLVALCKKLEALSQDKCISFPGGVRICLMYPGTPSSTSALARHLLGQLNSSLAPLQPIFSILEAVLAVAECMKAVPKLLTDPQELADCLPHLAKKIGALARLIPQLSVPLMILDIFDCLIFMMNALITDLERLEELSARLLNAQTQATLRSNTALRRVSDCASLNLTAYVAELNAGLTPLNHLFGTVNALLALIPPGNLTIPLVPDIQNPTDGIEELSKFVETLESIRGAIPIP